MSNPDIHADILSSVECTLKHMVKSAELIVDNLNYWGRDCGLEFFPAYQNLHKDLTAAINKFNQEKKS